MISQFTSIFGEGDINISNMVNKSRGDYAYSLLDFEHSVPAEMIEKIRSIEGVLRVRVME